ncbi:MAG: hypothetical protein H0V53_12320 [Rubrobacter sp.]|nr:hypothetical protein [Rubrobacter sp.]
MSEERYRLPGSPYEELANIIVAYGTRDEASNPGDVGKLDAVHQSSVSRNNAFLAAIGVLSGDRQKLVTPQGRELARALSRHEGGEIARQWRRVVSTNEFLQNVLSAVKLREGMLPSTLQAYIAHSAGQPRNKPVMTGASAIIGILKAAGLLKEEEGVLHATYEDPVEERDPASATGPEPSGISVSAVPGLSANVTVNINIQCSPEELDSLAPKIKRLLGELEG